MININQILKLSEELNDKYGGLEWPDSFYAHLKGVHDASEEVTKEICYKYYDLDGNINIEEIKFAAGMHDIGKIIHDPQLVHDLSGGAYVVDNWKKLELESVNQAYEIANIILTHGILKELYENEESGVKNEIGEIDSLKLIPKTLYQKIVAYADSCEDKGKRLYNVDEAYFNSVIDRYKESGEPSKIVYANCIEKAKKRLLDNFNFVKDLSQGKGDISKLEFL